jgi:sodium/potassium-transporting ATPase subunit alpha
MLKLCKLHPNASASPFPAPIASTDNFSDNNYLLTVKGAPEVLLPRCDYVVNPAGGPPIGLTSGVRERIVAIQEQWAQQGRRVLLLAKRIIAHEEIPAKMDKNSEDFSELVHDLNSELIVVGLVGLIDPLKPDIVQTVKVCRGAGIRFFVVTGENSA